MTQPNYNRTIRCSFVGYIVQAIVINYLPLLFVTLQTTYDIPLEKITMLVTVNFTLQLTVDLLSAAFLDRIGYRAGMVLAHSCAAVGLILLPILPRIMDPFTGILISVLAYAVGGGLLEVLVSPVVESCPTERKEQTMSLLHSFYCWGQVAVVLISTLFFAVFGIENWGIMAWTWAIIPIVSGLIFLKAPMCPIVPEGEKTMSAGQLFRRGIFWVFLILMFCAGASEQAVSQWASAFAETSLGISKTMGDLAGPMTFAITMGTARVIYAKFGDRIRLDSFMLGSCALCVLAYLMISLSPWPPLSLIGCAVCGFSVGILWPGTFSQATASLRNGGTVMFAMLALSGDLGCALGPSLVGYVSSAANDRLQTGILCALVFPVATIAIQLLRKKKKA